MAIPAHPVPAPGFSTDNKFPLLPAFTSMSAADASALGKWWNDVQIVMQRQFSQVTTEISGNTSDITSLEASELSESGAPSGVVVGTTAVDQWFSITSNGKNYMIPGWLNH